MNSDRKLSKPGRSESKVDNRNNLNQLRQLTLDTYMFTHSAQSDNKTKTKTPEKLKNEKPAEKSKKSKTIEKTESITYTEKETQSQSIDLKDNIIKPSLSTYTPTSMKILKQRSIAKYTTLTLRHRIYHTPLPLDNTNPECPDTTKTQNTNIIDKANYQPSDWISPMTQVQKRLH
jgi:hypothetical protein